MERDKNKTEQRTEPFLFHHADVSPVTDHVDAPDVYGRRLEKAYDRVLVYDSEKSKPLYYIWTQFRNGPALVKRLMRKYAGKWVTAVVKYGRRIRFAGFEVVPEPKKDEPADEKPEDKFVQMELFEDENGQDKSFKPDVAWLKRKYDEFNKSLFDGRLGPCDFGIFTNGEGHMLGYFTMQGNVYHHRSDRRMLVKMADGTTTYIGRQNFYLCRPVIKLNGSYSGLESGFENTLVHEMCHYYTYMDGVSPRQAHGREFRSIAARIASVSNDRFSIKRTANADELATNYTLDADIVAKREKRERNRVRSAMALFMFFKDGEIRLHIAKDNATISKMIWRAKTMPGFKKAILSRNEDVIEFLFNHGYGRVFRTVSWWSNVNRHPWIGQIVDLITDPANQGAHEVAESIDDDMEKIPPGMNLSVETPFEAGLEEGGVFENINKGIKGKTMKGINENQKVTLTIRQLKKLVREGLADTTHHDWAEFDEFDKYIDKYLPNIGEGDTMASQIATAVCKLVYRWFNDGDLYDNTENGMRYFNDLSSYANWLYKYVQASRGVLDGIFDIKAADFDGEYADLLYELCISVLPNIDDYADKEKIGSVYKCGGPFKTVEQEEDEDEDY